MIHHSNVFILNEKNTENSLWILSFPGISSFTWKLIEAMFRSFNQTEIDREKRKNYKKMLLPKCFLPIQKIFIKPKLLSMSHCTLQWNRLICRIRVSFHNDKAYFLFFFEAKPLLYLWFDKKVMIRLNNGNSHKKQFLKVEKVIIVHEENRLFFFCDKIIKEEVDEKVVV